jgi:Tfp pilus assembly protein PilO
MTMPAQRRFQFHSLPMSAEELRAQIKAKKAELAALEKLRDQSAALVAHLEGMGTKFGELRDGTAGTCALGEL